MVKDKYVQSHAREGKPPWSLSNLTMATKLGIILFIVSCLVYANSIKNGYVLDDVMMITENQYVKKGFEGIPILFKTLHLQGFGVNNGSDYYRPLCLVMFAVEYQFFGLNPTEGHFLNIILFAVCVVLLFSFLNKLFRNERVVVAFIASLLFAVHPIHTEVVANIKSRDELLCFFFAFLSLNIFINYARKGKLYLLLLGFFCFLLSVLSKETAITFIGIIPLVFFFYENENKKRSVLITASAVAVVVIFVSAWLYLLGQKQPGNAIGAGTIFNISTSMPGASKFAPKILILGYYIRLLFVPWPLNFSYSFNAFSSASLGDIWVLVSLTVYLLLGIVGFIRLFKNKNDPWAFGILFYLITLSLFSNIIFLLGQALANRFAFFPSVGFCILMALAFEKWVLRKERSGIADLKSKLSIAILLPVLLIYSIMTMARNTDWSSNYTLVNADIIKSPQDAYMQYKAGLELQKKYDEEPDSLQRIELNAESIKYFLRSLEIDPEYTEAHADLGVAYFRINNFDSAELHFKHVLTLNPAHLNALTNLGTLYYTKQQFMDAIHYYQNATAISTANEIAWYNMGICFARIGQNDSAIMCMKKVIKITPQYDNYKSYGNTAILYKLIGNMDSAKKYELMMKQYYSGFSL